MNIEFNYGRNGNASGNEPVDTDDAPVVVEQVDEFPSLAPQRRFQPPRGFGAGLTESTPRAPSTSLFGSQPRIGARQPSVSSLNPTPSENRDEEINLTPSQNDVLIPGGQEIASAVAKVLHNERNIKEFKIMTHAFKTGVTTASKYLADFVSLAERGNQKKRATTLFTEMSSVWHRVAELFPEDQQMVQKYEVLAKKSKKKGLSIQEFEQMKNGEPKKTAMLRAWNDHKAKVIGSN